jgi:hypothetical protein
LIIFLIRKIDNFYYKFTYYQFITSLINKGKEKEMDDNPQLHGTTSTPHQLESLRDDIEVKPSSQQVSSPVSSKKRKKKSAKSH